MQAWRPYLQKDIDKMERVQRRATKMIDECKRSSYEDRLKFTGLSTLEARRIRGDMIEVFKILKGISKLDSTSWLQLANNSRTRGHRFKLVKKRSRLDIRKHFFSQRVVNRVPVSVRSCVRDARNSALDAKIEKAVRPRTHKICIGRQKSRSNA